MRFHIFATYLCALLVNSQVQSALLTETRTIKACRTKVATSVIIYKASVYLQTSVLTNTTFALNQQLSITVNDAPTYLDTIASYITRRTFADTIYPSPSSLLSHSDITPFILAIAPRRSGQHGDLQSRQAFSFLALSGLTSSDCSTAASFSLTNGRLSYTNSSGTMMFGAPSSTLKTYSSFVPSSNPGEVTTTFSLGQKGTLLWTSSSFPTGSASFCVRDNGAILAVFVMGTQPTDCVFTDIAIADLSICLEGFNIASGPTGPTGPPGPTGSPGPSGPQGLSGLPGASGASGLPGMPGASGISGMSGGSGLSGQVGPTGASGLSGMPGASGLSGQVGASGASGLSGISGASGLSGRIGPTGPTGAIGPTGPTGVSGVSGASGMIGATGPPGPSGSPAIEYAYYGCYVQTGTPSTGNLALGFYKGTFTSNINQNCATTCKSGNYNFGGTVNNSTTSGDCYCDNTLTLVTNGILGASGRLVDSNCVNCNSGSGQCGTIGSKSIAVWAKAF